MFILTIIFYFSLILTVKVNELFLAGIIVLPFYLAYSYMFEETTKYILNIHEFNQFYQNLILARDSRPVLKMVISDFENNDEVSG